MGQDQLFERGALRWGSVDTEIIVTQNFFQNAFIPDHALDSCQVLTGQFRPSDEPIGAEQDPVLKGLNKIPIGLGVFWEKREKR